MVTTYTGWQVGDVINICASIDEFCGTYNQFIFANDINVTKSPGACTLVYGTERGCGLHLNNVQLTFKLAKFSGSTQEKTCTPEQLYKTIGSVRTNSNGVSSLSYTVTDQDRLDYENATNGGYPYKVIACITDADGNSVLSTQTSVVTNNIIIAQNLCYGVTCDDICIGNDLYYQICNPVNGQCIQGTLKETNSLICQATHYIELDFSSLDSSFLGFILTNIANLSNWLVTHLPTPSNIIYKQATYENGKFRIYVRYTPPSLGMEGLATLYSYDSYRIRLYNTYRTNIFRSKGTDKVSYLNPGIFDWITSGVQLLLDSYAAIISTIILFMIAGQFGIEFGLGVGIIAIILAAIISYYIIKDVLTGVSTSGSAPTDDPHTKITNIDCFVNYLEVQCYNNYGCILPSTPPSGCTPPSVNPTPPTCTQSALHDYMVCTGNTRVAQIVWNNSQTGKGPTDPGYVDPSQVNSALLDCIAKLQNSTYTIDQAKVCFNDNVTVPADDSTGDAKNTTDCSSYGSGYIYDKTQKKCVSTCNVPILGGCADSVILFGGLALGGYVIYKIVSGRKAQELVVKSEK